MEVLVDEDGHRAIRGQRLQHLPNRALPIDHRVPAPRANTLEHVVQIRIVQRPRHHSYRLHAHRERERPHFPVAEVPGKQQHPMPLRMRLPDPLLTFDLDAEPGSRSSLSVPTLISSNSTLPKCANTPAHDRAPLLEWFRGQRQPDVGHAPSADESRRRLYTSRPSTAPSATDADIGRTASSLEGPRTRPSSHIARSC